MTARDDKRHEDDPCDWPACGCDPKTGCPGMQGLLQTPPSHERENDGSDRRRRNIGHEPERRVTNGSVRDASVASATRRTEAEQLIRDLKVELTIILNGKSDNIGNTHPLVVKAGEYLRRADGGKQTNG